MPRILVVDDSPTARAALRAAFAGEPDFTVVAEASNGEETMAAIVRHQPDIVTMDVHLQGESGLTLTARIMASHPVPVLMITGVKADDPELAFRAIAAGALEVRPKLPPVRSPRYPGERRRLLRLVQTLAQVPVVTRRRQHEHAAGAQPPSPRARRARHEVLLIGASTGGPPLLRELLSALPAPLAVPVVVVQHIFEGFDDGLAHWLSQATPHPAVVCHDELPLHPGTVALAPGNRNVVLRPPQLLCTVQPLDRRHHVPSIDQLFESAAGVLGSRAVGVLLTGMGHDGSAGLAALRRRGALTIAQDPASCVIESMPRAAIRAGAAELVLRPEAIAAELRRRLVGPA